MSEASALEGDFERRFGGLRRLYGAAGAQAIFSAHVLVVGIGGVGSWAAEALARSGVGRITLVDMDHIGLSNTNRQIHALGEHYGRAKVDAMRERILAINPGACVQALDDFVTPENWLACLARSDAAPSGAGVAVIDACDHMPAKVTMAAWAVAQRALFITVGAAGGKRQGERVELADVSLATHDPLLAQLRYRLRKHHQAVRAGRLGVQAVFSREAVAAPSGGTCAVGEMGTEGTSDGSLNCHGYGSSVSVTATFGMCAAGWIMDQLAHASTQKKSA